MMKIKITRKRAGEIIDLAYDMRYARNFQPTDMETIEAILNACQEISNETVEKQKLPVGKEGYEELSAFDEAVKKKFDKFKEKNLDLFKQNNDSIPETLKGTLIKQLETVSKEHPAGKQQVDDFFKWVNEELAIEEVEIEVPGKLSGVGFNIIEYGLFKQFII